MYVHDCVVTCVLAVGVGQWLRSVQVRVCEPLAGQVPKSGHDQFEVQATTGGTEPCGST